MTGEVPVLASNPAIIRSRASARIQSAAMAATQHSSDNSNSDTDAGCVQRMWERSFGTRPTFQFGKSAAPPTHPIISWFWQFQGTM